MTPAFLKSTVWRKIAPGALAVAALGGVIGNAAYDWVKALATRIEATPPPAGDPTGTWVFITLIVVAAASMWVVVALTADVIRHGFRVRAIGAKDNDVASEVLVLGLSLFSEGEIAGGEVAREAILAFLEGEADGRLTGLAGGREVHGDGEWKLADLCEPGVQIVGLSGTAALDDVSWQQAWRTVRRQLESRPRRLTRIEIVASYVFSHNKQKELADFVEALKLILDKELGKTHGIAVHRQAETYDDMRLDEVQTMIEGIIDAARSRSPSARVCVDITGATRAYSAAAAICTLRENVIMSYVTRNRPSVGSLPGAEAYPVMGFDLENRF